MIKQDVSSTLCLKTSTTRAPVCDTCRSSPSTIFCQADLAYLCSACDSQVHAAHKLSSAHKRVSLCEACEQAPAAYVCKADAASLCATCDAVIHSANPLSRRHHRVLVMPVSGSVVYGHQPAEPWGPSGGGFFSQESEGTEENEDEDEAASWLVFDSPLKNSQSQNGESNRTLLCDGDEYLDLVEFNSCQDNQFSDEFQFEDGYKYMNDGGNNDGNNQQRYGGCDADSVVPVHCGEVKKYHQLHQHSFQDQKFQLGMDYEAPNGGYGYPASLGHSVSMSSLEAGTVPDSTITETDASISNARNPNATIDLFSVQMPTQLPPIDREARVLRYREKKKTRKFEKTIRYASRKAYAETRPRIKGRFAKRTTNVDIEVDQMLSPKLIIEGGYCIFPSS